MSVANSYPKVQGRCPACGCSSLFLGRSGYVTCGLLSCSAPSSAHALLAPEDSDWAARPLAPTPRAEAER